MTDLKFDFVSNDIEISGGDLDIVTMSSLQNASLIFNKSLASITKPQVGVGFEEYFPNLPQWAWGNIEAKGESQMKNDGAVFYHVEILPTVDGKVNYVKIEARYRE